MSNNLYGCFHQKILLTCVYSGKGTANHSVCFLHCWLDTILAVQLVSKTGQ